MLHSLIISFQHTLSLIDGNSSRSHYWGLILYLVVVLKSVLKNVLVTLLNYNYLVEECNKKS